MNRLSPHERERYVRQVVIPSWGEEAQARIARATVFVAGIGGLGSSAILYLAAAGVGCIRACDRGRVELSNLNRQVLHGERSIGRRKTRSAGSTVRRLNRHVRFAALPDEMTDANAADLAGDAAVLLDCLDNVPSRLVLNRLSVRSRVPLVHAGVRGLAGQISFLHPPATPCLACFLEEGPAEEPLPILGATAGVMGCLQALEALKYLAGMDGLAENRIVFFDGASMSFDSVPVARRPGCPACGSSPA